MKRHVASLVMVPCIALVCAVTPGAEAPPESGSAVSLFDGKTFDPAAPDAYLKSLAIKRAVV